jgi:hypothetical protein
MSWKYVLGDELRQASLPSVPKFLKSMRHSQAYFISIQFEELLDTVDLLVYLQKFEILNSNPVDCN